MEAPVVEVRKLSKHFISERPLHRILLAPFGRGREICALHDVSFTVASGEILGVAGPNGAGKTTLLRVMANLLEADKGSVRFCGRELSSLGHSVRGDIGYVSNDERSFFWRLTGAQNLEFFGCLYGLSRTEARHRIDELLECFALRRQAGRFFRDYSSGTRKKFAIVRALVHQPRLLLLDEATNSLDPASTHDVKSLVRTYVSSCKGRAGIWSTHRLEEIGEICNKALVIHEGRVDFFGPAQEQGSMGRMLDRRRMPPKNQDRHSSDRCSEGGVYARLGQRATRLHSLAE